MTDAGIVRAFVDEIDALRAEVEKQTQLANVAAERMRTAEYREDLLKQDVETWRRIWNDEAMLAGRAEALRDGTADLGNPKDG